MTAQSDHLDHEGIQREYAIFDERIRQGAPKLIDWLHAAYALGIPAHAVDVMDVNDQRMIRREATGRGVVDIKRLADMWRADNRSDQ